MARFALRTFPTFRLAPVRWGAGETDSAPTSDETWSALSTLQLQHLARRFADALAQDVGVRIVRGRNPQLNPISFARLLDRHADPVTADRGALPRRADVAAGARASVSMMPSLVLPTSPPAPSTNNTLPPALR